MLYAPAQPRCSPRSSQDSIAVSSSTFITTFVVTADVCGSGSHGNQSAIPVTTWCERPESERSIRRASSSSTGFPSTPPSSTTTVSKHRMVWPVHSAISRAATAFSTASEAASSAGRDARGVSRDSGVSTDAESNSSPSQPKRRRLRGDCDARRIFGCDEVVSMDKS